MTVYQMLAEIRKIISRCDAPEIDVYEALVSEAEGWEMRLNELEDDIEEDDE